MSEKITRYAAFDAAVDSGMLGRTGNIAAYPREVRKPLTSVDTTPQPTVDAGGGFKYGILRYADTAARREAPIVHPDIPTSARWTVNSPLAGGTFDTANRLPVPLVEEPTDTHAAIEAAEQLRAEPNDTPLSLISLVRRQQAVLGVPARVAADHVMGPDSVAGRHWPSVRRSSSLGLHATEQTVADQRRRRAPTHSDGAAAKAVITAEITHIEEAQRQAKAYRAAERQAAQESDIVMLDPATVGELLDTVLDQAGSAAKIKERQRVKPLGERLSWFNTGGDMFADQMRGHTEVDQVKELLGDATAEIVTGVVTGEPADVETQFAALKAKVNPNGGGALVKAPMAAKDTLWRAFTDSKTDGVVVLDETLQFVPVDGDSVVIVYRAPVTAKT